LVYSDDVNRADFKKLALTRLDDARVLLRNRRYSAAYYLAGYAVECSLRACLAKKTRRFDFPPEPEQVKNVYYIHKLETLAKASGLLQVLRGTPKLDTYWTLVKNWSETSRYDARAGNRAKDILLAIEDPAEGVLQCIKHYW